MYRQLILALALSSPAICLSGNLGAGASSGTSPTMPQREAYTYAGKLLRTSAVGLLAVGDKYFRYTDTTSITNAFGGPVSDSDLRVGQRLSCTYFNTAEGMPVLTEIRIIKR